MANDFSKNPMVIDTTGTAYTGREISINSIQWVDPTTVGHACVLVDQNGNTIFKAKCVVANQSLIKYFRPGFVFKGLNLSTLDSGEVHLLYNWTDEAGERTKPYRD